MTLFMTRQEMKRAIRKYLRLRWSDSDLVRGLEHARSGKMSFASCCCLVGLPSADHPDGELAGREQGILAETHYAKIRRNTVAKLAEYAFGKLGYNDSERNRRLVPILLAEIRRRMRKGKFEAECETVWSGCSRF